MGRVWGFFLGLVSVSVSVSVVWMYVRKEGEDR